VQQAENGWPTVSVITVSLNGKKWLKELFESILASDYPQDKIEIIFVDNGSTDGSVEFVKDMFRNDARMKIIQNTENLGWSPANNQGMKVAFGEILVCVSNDMIVETNWIKEIVKVMKADKQIGMVQCNSISMWDRKTPDSGMNYLDRFGYSYSYVSSKTNHEVFFAEGMAFAIKKEVIDKVGVFDNYFFMEYDDMDLSWRARLGGYNVFFVPTAIVYHARGGTVGATYFQRVNNVTWYTRNHLVTLIKNYELKTLLRLSPIILTVELIKILYLALVKKNLIISYAALKGILQVMADRRVILQKRVKTQSFRAVSDNEILQIMHPFNPWLLRLFLAKQSKSERLVLNSYPPINWRSK
jgi:GT2 family glycosyltransferase